VLGVNPREDDRADWGPINLGSNPINNDNQCFHEIKLAIGTPHPAGSEEDNCAKTREHKNIVLFSTIFHILTRITAVNKFFLLGL